MKYLSNLILFVFVIAASLSCQELIYLDLEQADPRIVVEGEFTDEQGPHRVKISSTINYYDTGQMQPVDDAIVELLDSAENLIQEFSYHPEDSSYKSSENLSGKVGKSYILRIRAEGDTYEAKGKILENATLDSIYYVSDEFLEAAGQPVFGEGYFLFANGQLNREGTQFFRLQISVNDTLKNARGDIANSILSSEFFGSSFTGLPIPGSFEANDTVTLELYSINEDVFQYYSEFINLLYNDGGVFSPPPVNPTSNIENLTNPEKSALGYMQFSSFKKEEVIIAVEESP